MKTAKRLLAIVMMLAMAMMFTVPVFATNDNGNNGKITIEKAESNITYTIYKLLDLESYNAETGAYSYRVADGWKDFFEGENAAGAAYVSINDLGYVTWKAEKGGDNSSDAAAFAKAALQYATDNSISNNGTQRATGTTVTFENLELGYYLVDSSMGSLCSLDTTNPEVTIYEKNQLPQISKKADNANFNNAAVGDTVNFKVTITTEAGKNKVPDASDNDENGKVTYAKNYVLHDMMGDGFTFNPDSVTVKYTSGTTTVELTKDTDYTIKTSDLDDTCTFEIDFIETFENDLNANDVIEITYTATLNANATEGGDHISNKAEIKHDSGETPSVETKTYTYSFDVYKCTGEGDEKTALAGAKFTLSKNADGSAPIAFDKASDSETYTVCATANHNDTAHVTEITTDSTGTFKLQGLKASTYYLTETAAPSGYNKLAGPIKAVIAQGETDKSSCTVTYYNYQAGDNHYDNDNGTTATNNKIEVQNQSGTELPSTGGIGTTVFYVAGGILVAAAVVLLVTRKRMGDE